MYIIHQISGNAHIKAHYCALSLTVPGGGH